MAGSPKTWSKMTKANYVKAMLSYLISVSLGIQPATVRGLDTHASAGHRLKIGKVYRNESNTHTI